MLQLFRTLNLPYLARRWERTLLIVASIALGVATLVSTQLLSNTISDVIYDTTTPLAGADLLISNGEAGVLPEIADDLRKANLPGIDRIMPFVIDRVDLPELDHRLGVLLGIDLKSAGEQKPSDPLKFKITLLPQNPFTIRNPVAVSRALYDEQQKVHPGEPLTIRIANTRHKLSPIAVLDIDSNSPAASFAANFIAMDVQQAMTLMRTPISPGLLAIVGGVGSVASTQEDKLTRVDIFLAPGAKLDAVRKAAQEVVGNRSTVLTPEAQKRSTEDIVGGIKTSFTVCSLGALIVGLFLVYNALSVSVAERRHDIGILRSLGSSRWQLASLFAREAILLGFIGAVLGIPLGIFIAEVALNLFREELSSVFLSGVIELKPINLPIWTLAIVAGMLTALLAAMIPTWQAATDQPAEVVRRSPNHVARIWRILHWGMVILLVASGVTMVFLRDSFPRPYGNYAGLMTTLVGLFLALPLLVRFLALLFQPLLRGILGIESRLASDNLVVAPGRTGIVVGALAAGVSLMFQTAGVGRSNEEPVMRWIDQVIQADGYVFWGNIATSNSSATPMESSVASRLKDMVPEIDHVVGVHFSRPEFNNCIIYCLAIDAHNYQSGIESRVPAGPDGLDQFKRLADGNYCIISDNFSIKHKVKPGDTIQIPGPRGLVSLEVIGRGLDYTWNKGTIFIDRKKYKELFDEDSVDIFHVFFKQGADKDATFAKLRTATASMDLIVQDRAFLRKYLVEVIEKIYKIAYVQQLIIGTVASLGVITALLISVLQRRRELGLLRAVGATRSQILMTVLAEAVFIGILGALFGFALGLPMEWFVLHVVIFEESGFFFPMIIPWNALIGITITSIGIATLAGLLPAYQAMRMRITDAIAYE